MPEPERLKSGDVLSAANYNALRDRILADVQMHRGFASPDARSSRAARPMGFDFRGQSAEAIPAFSVFGVNAGVSTGSPPKVTVAKFATGDETPVILTNGPQAITATGHEVPCWIVNDNRPMLLAADATNPPTAGASCGVKLGDWTVTSEAEGLLALSGAFSGPGGVNVAWCLRTHGGGGVSLFRFTLTAGMALTSANATITDMDGNAQDSDTIRDPHNLFGFMVSGDKGLAIKQGGKYYVVTPETTEIAVMTDARVDGFNLQKKTRTVRLFPTAAESVWTTWHAGDDCDGA